MVKKIKVSNRRFRIIQNLLNYKDSLTIINKKKKFIRIKLYGVGQLEIKKNFRKIRYSNMNIDGGWATKEHVLQNKPCADNKLWEITHIQLKDFIQIRDLKYYSGRGENSHIRLYRLRRDSKTFKQLFLIYYNREKINEFFMSDYYKHFDMDNLDRFFKIFQESVKFRTKDLLPLIPDLFKLYVGDPNKFKESIRKTLKGIFKGDYNKMANTIIQSSALLKYIDSLCQDNEESALKYNTKFHFYRVMNQIDKVGSYMKKTGKILKNKRRSI